jgi:microcystin-dependent protein
MSILIGTIMSVGYDVVENIPAGFLACDGSEVSRETFAGLYSIIGNSWGNGDGATTFNTPDLRGIFLRGVSDGSGKDPDASLRSAIKTGGATGDAVGSIQLYATASPKSAQLATTVPAGATIQTDGNHVHSVSHLPDDNSWYKIAGDHYAKWNSNGVNTSVNGSHYHTIASGGDAETRPVNVYVDYIIYSGV